MGTTYNPSTRSSQNHEVETRMTARILTGSKSQIAEQHTSIEGEVRQVVVLIDDMPAAPPLPIPATVEELFKEMEPYMAHGGGNVDYSREGIYSRKPGE
jgi:hypothetical protein